MDSSSLTPPSTSAPLTNALATASPTRYGGYGTVGGPSGPGGVGTNDPSSLFPRALGQVQLGDNELDEIYAYCFDRGNGQYTRLIPADMLPPLQDIPALQQGCVGMKVLPVPRGLAPNGRSSNSERVALQPRPNPLVNNPGDPIQSHIDSIIALSPPPASQKRPKIYCDKWVHEGVCAFTQQGCKYKHEMPFDKATQHSLGLFHGLPAWWKKHQAELARQRDLVDASDQPVAVSSRDRSLSGPNRLTANPWRRIPSVGPNPIQYSSPFGPIGPPPRKPADESSPDRLTRGIADMNPFSMLRHVDENGDDDNEEGVRLA
ncbi:hypothetical protein QBC33DRAFT_511877 [Phialemonium atrogriseum]|uniref:C3H1-type domain-containing protein n=1 Tax=Phialemonium atrogriseum TaxID=1093897 RepID=A0AAJ0FJY8_9PEZI|nr:uncharacterized protein QBC33DRAFT_511877 [Phialemonium atrogriseum]KAK1771086.1 hypothetical protein QBC33DRAFT_511877 [Phialemonium atrogriseum]